MKKAEIKQRITDIAHSKTVKRILLATVCVIAVLCLLRLLLLVFPVKAFEIEGDTKYELAEVINAAGIRKGDRAYGINKAKIEKELMEKCPYILSVNIKIKFPNTVCFEIVEAPSGWYMQVGDDFYALDHDLRVLMETDEEEMLSGRGLTKLVLPELESVICGEYVGFGRDDERLISETLKIVDKIRNDDIKERLTYLDLSNRFQIKMSVDTTFEVDFGDMDDADTKLEMIIKIVDENKAKNYAGGEINVIDPSVQGFRGYFAENGESQKNDEVNDE